jgi:hypothetical protein
MIHDLRKNLTYANVVATLALVLALAGGTAYAANTIGSSDVIDNSLRSADLRDGSGVSGADVIDNSVTGGDIDESKLGKVPDADKLDGVNSSAFARKPLRLDFFAEYCSFSSDPGCTKTFTLQNGVVLTVQCEESSGRAEEFVLANAPAGVRTNVTALKSGPTTAIPQQFSIEGDGIPYSLQGSSNENAVGTAVISSGTAQLTINFHASTAFDPDTGFAGCTFEGTATVA